MNQDESKRMIDELNAELDVLLYAISHDLRAPLRAIDGFSKAVEEDYADQLDDMGRDYLARVRSAGIKINLYVEGLLHMSRESRGEMTLETVRLSALVDEVVQLLSAKAPNRRVTVSIQGDVAATMDRRLARTLMEKLLDNAWKFTSATENPTVVFGVDDVDGVETFFVRDNGVGFDMQYAEGRVFGPFQRMHGEDEFPGMGIGLATAKRIVNRHGGRIWIESEPGKGTTVFFRVGRD